MFTVIIKEEKKTYVSQYSTYSDAKDFYEFACAVANESYVISLIDGNGDTLEERK